MLLVMFLFNGVLDYLILTYTWAQVASAVLGLAMLSVLSVVYVRQHPRRAVMVLLTGLGLGVVLLGGLLLVMKVAGR